MSGVRLCDRASTTYTYNNGGTGSQNQPTTLTVTGGTSPAPSSYGYDTVGQMTGSTTPTQGTQTFSWNALGELVGSTTTAGGTASTTGPSTSNVCDASGNLLIQTDPSGTTLYLPDEQITLVAGTGSTTADWYYKLAGGATVVRTGTGNSYSFELAD